MADQFVVEGLNGEKRLQGEIAVGGAKNAILKALAASVLFKDGVEFLNVPEIEDVKRMRELLIGLQDGPVLRKDIAERMRSSIVLTGPVLARYGQVSFPFPGGCVLGERPIDLFVDGFTAMGATVTEDENDYFTITAKDGLRGAVLHFPFISVTATETLMLAAVLAKGETTLNNCALEPEIPLLADYLNSCGAHIEGAGTSTIRIVGGDLLAAKGKQYVTPPDRIEAGSFLILAALTAKEVSITQCEPKHLTTLITLLQRAGVDIEVGENTIIVRGSKPNDAYKNVSVRTHEYPGFPTDLQAPMAVFMTQASGEATILETIFDGRFRYADDLVRMGADITVMNPHKMLIRGPKKLSRKDMESPDLRGGLAYLLAAAVAEGTSTIKNAYLIDRGYERIEERLQKLGLSIRRVTE